MISFRKRVNCDDKKNCSDCLKEATLNESTYVFFKNGTMYGICDKHLNLRKQNAERDEVIMIDLDLLKSKI